MALNGCLFAVQLPSPDDRALVEARIGALERWYRALGEASASTRFASGAGLLLGAIRFDGAAVNCDEPIAWGSPPPAALATNAALVGASDAELRTLDGPFAAVAADGRRAVLVAAAGGVTSLYEAAANGITAWSSHAVAAAWLASGEARLAVAAVPELVAAELVGGEETLIAGARALPLATRVEVAAESRRVTSFWPAAERLRPVPPAAAAAQAETALLRSLERRLAGADAPVVGLTAGLDSRVALAALGELGIRASAFTFGDPASDDARGGAAAAAAVGVPHRVGPFEWWSDAEGLQRLHAEVRWNEGLMPVGFGRVPWPAMSHWVAGIGAETGRAFLYRWAAPGSRGAEPSKRLLAAVLAGHFEDRLAGADPGLRRRLRARWRGWVEEALALGHRGWNALDVVYATQRVSRWGRAQLPRFDACAVPAFATPEQLAALASLPLRERLSDGFARRFLAARRVDAGLPPPAPTRPRGAVPLALARRRAVLRARDARRALRLPRPARTQPWFASPPWDARPSFLGWLGETVLRSPTLDEAFGARWLEETRAGFLRGDPAAAELTMWAAAPVALEASLRELRLD